MKVAFPEFVELSVVDDIVIANDVAIKANIEAAQIADYAVIVSQDALAEDGLIMVPNNEVIVVSVVLFIAVAVIDEAGLATFAIEQAALNIDVLIESSRALFIAIDIVKASTTPFELALFAAEDDLRTADFA